MWHNGMESASFGPYLVEQGGGVLVMKWDENDISIRALAPFDLGHVDVSY